MDIGIFGAIIFVAIMVWLPLVGVFALVAFTFAQLIPFTGTSKEKLSKSIFWTGVLFIPTEIILMSKFYKNEEPGPPFWLFICYGLAGFIVFYIWSKITIPNEK